MDYTKYRHEDYASKAKLEWLILGCCPIGDRAKSDSSGFTPCGKWAFDRFRLKGCDFMPGGNSWDHGARCSPLWIKRYNIPKRTEKGGDDTT
jgi:hypothetical protein